jgi:hypothetical protein
MGTALMDRPDSKQAFLDILRAERRRWQELLDRFDGDLLVVPGPDGTWSVRDIVVHVTAYERGLVEWLRAAALGETVAFPVLDHPDVDHRNTLILAEAEGRSLADVLSAAERTFRDLIAAVEALPDEQLFAAQETSWYVEPRWGAPQAVWECIADDSYRHYAQHAADLRARIEELQRGAGDGN